MFEQSEMNMKSDQISAYMPPELYSSSCTLAGWYANTAAVTVRGLDWQIRLVVVTVLHCEHGATRSSLCCTACMYVMC